MSIGSYILGRGNKLVANVIDEKNKNSLIVSTRPYEKFEHKIKFFRNDTYGIDLNQNVTFGGTPEEVHNGTDDALWTGSAISGTWTFDTTDQAQGGTKSIDATATVNNDVAQIAKGSNLTVSGYTAFSGYVYLDAILIPDTKSIDIYGWDTGTGAIVGNSVNILNYIDTGVLDTWQKFAIPLTSMGLTAGTIDAIRIVTVGNPAPDYYLDDLQFEETGTSQEYLIRPDSRTWLHVLDLNIVLVDALAGTLADATMAALAYNKILAETALTIGITFKHVKDQEIMASYTFKNLFNFLELPGMRISDNISDGTNTMIKLAMPFKEPLILKDEERDYISLTVNDDLSGLIKFVANCECKEEKVNW